ncbi:MAG TPA: LpqB family beta-propeller domain-containing protein [Pseudonocardiaceae bacterium]|nr:LpqB family beta-propeller domain-containing protein [Pseudonocardiaceae bacterium]
MRSAVIALCAALGLLLAGCAAIPGETTPQRADLQNGNVSPGIAEPPKDEDPLTIVRSFVDQNGDPTDLHASARGYLAKSAQTTWNLSSAPASVMIIGDTYNTTYGQQDGTDPNLEDVEVLATLIGNLNSDGSFQPPSATEGNQFHLSLQLKRGSDGQWRILNPPDSLVITQADFESHYRPVSVYFFDQGWDVLVPDPRYVVSDPIGLPGRIVQLLLDGPSSSIKDAVLDAIPPSASLKTNVTELSDGQIYVNFNAIPDLPSNTKQLMVAQIVRSLQNYGSSVAVESETVPLVPGHNNWRLADLPQYVPYVGPNATSLMVAHGRIFNLTGGQPIAGPAGHGDYEIVTAAQSMDGQELATVVHKPEGGEELRIGGFKGTEQPVKDLTAQTFTRPTWEPGDAAGDASRAVWTVANGIVERVAITPQGGWAASPVDASALAPYGAITDLRLSKDGVRVAVAAGGHLLVGAVVVDQGSVAIKQVQEEPSLAGVTRVDWLRQDLLVVATTQPGKPVLSVSVDGEKVEQYSPANLTSAVTALAASQSGPVYVADAAGIWSSTDLNEVWTPVAHNQGAGAIPVYPG